MKVSLEMTTELIKTHGIRCTQRKEHIIVDDINDTGATFEWIKDDWKLENKHPK